ncbi:hypothetical protein [Kingella potus]|uniref:hypothetical protein n=1 Tax=Kingella potus TaxID=265175 RepID=UPI001FD51D50|nr:hypothetical protein [Kingella potus]UOP01140.1 hypothetical protein LVJ84_02105 [Kingella potus]
MVRGRIRAVEERPHYIESAPLPKGKGRLKTEPHPRRGRVFRRPQNTRFPLRRSRFCLAAPCVRRHKAGGLLWHNGGLSVCRILPRTRRGPSRPQSRRDGASRSTPHGIFFAPPRFPSAPQLPHRQPQRPSEKTQKAPP